MSDGINIVLVVLVALCTYAIYKQAEKRWFPEKLSEFGEIMAKVVDYGEPYYSKDKDWNGFMFKGDKFSFCTEFGSVLLVLVYTSGDTFKPKRFKLTGVDARVIRNKLYIRAQEQHDKFVLELKEKVGL